MYRYYGSCFVLSLVLFYCLIYISCVCHKRDEMYIIIYVFIREFSYIVYCSSYAIKRAVPTVLSFDNDTVTNG